MTTNRERRIQYYLLAHFGRIREEERSQFSDGLDRGEYVHTSSILSFPPPAFPYISYSLPIFVRVWCEIQLNSGIRKDIELSTSKRLINRIDKQVSVVCIVDIKIWLTLKRSQIQLQLQKLALEASLKSPRSVLKSRNGEK